MSENFKEKDREKIVAYMVDKNQVCVSDLIDKCGAEKLRIYPLLFELIQEKRIKVLQETATGAPEIVALNK